MSHYKPYPAYRDSGVEWIGEVPKDWSIQPVKQVFATRLGKMISPKPSSEDDLLVPYHRAQTVQWEKIEHEQAEKMWASGKEIASYGVRSGDLLICEGGDVCRAAICDIEPAEPTIIQNSIHRVRSKGFIKVEWLLHLMQLVRSSEWIDVLCNKNTIVHFTSEKLDNLRIPVPSVQEHGEILEHLNRETARIDALIAKKARFIELLKEKRQALITHAVTKGLDPNVKMKNSGVEWIGEVPEHWAVVAVRRLTPVQRGASPRPIDDPKYFDDEGRFGWTRIEDVSLSDGVLRKTKQRLSQLGASLSVKLAPGDLFLSIAATVGKPCISAIEVCIHDGFVYFPQLKIDPWWLFRIFECGSAFIGLGKLGTQLNLNTETVAAIKLPVPPPTEVHEVLNFIKDRTARIDALVVKTQLSIDLLKERRSAFITAAVTGKIDLRNKNVTKEQS